MTVAQQAGLAALLAGATPAITTTPTYHLVDTVDALTAVSSTILMGSNDGYDISDSLANVAAGADGLVNHAKVATAKVAFGAKGVSEDGKTAADVVTTTVKYDDLDGKIDAGTGSITLAKADGDKAAGDAIVSVDATGVKDLVSVDMGTFFANADSLNASHITLKYIASNNEAVTGTDGADIIVAGKGGNVITGGAGADKITLGAGADKVVLDAVDAAGIDTITGMTKIDSLAFKDVAAATKVVDADFDSMADLNAVLATFAQGAAHEIAVNTANVFTFKGEMYVVINDGTAGYLASSDAVVHLAGVSAEDVVAMGDIFTA